MASVHRTNVPQIVKVNGRSKIMITCHYKASIVAYYHALNMAAIFSDWESFIQPYLAILGHVQGTPSEASRINSIRLQTLNAVLLRKWWLP